MEQVGTLEEWHSNVGDGVLVGCFKFNMDVMYMAFLPFYTPNGLCIFIIAIGVVSTERFYLITLLSL